MANLTEPATFTLSPQSLSPFVDFLSNTLIPGLLLIFIPIGICGNLLSLIVFIKRRKADRVSAQYLSVLAFFDLILISVYAPTMWMLINLERFTNGRLIYTSQFPSTAICKFTDTVWNICVLNSGWILSLFSFERCLVTWYPLKMAPIVSSGKPRKAALITVFVTSCFVCSGASIWTKLLPSTEGRPYPLKCKFDNENYSQPFWLIWWNLNNVVFAHGMPLVFISILNVLIIIGVRKNRFQGQTTQSNTNDSRALLNLLLVSLAYIVFLTPFEVTYCLQTYYNFRGWLDVAKQPLFVQAWLTSDTFQYFNYGVNSFIYTFSLKFYRAEIKKVFCCCMSRSTDKDIGK